MNNPKYRFKRRMVYIYLNFIKKLFFLTNKTKTKTTHKVLSFLWRIALLWVGLEAIRMYIYADVFELIECVIWKKNIWHLPKRLISAKTIHLRPYRYRKFISHRWALKYCNYTCKVMYVEIWLIAMSTFKRLMWDQLILAIEGLRATMC